MPPDPTTIVSLTVSPGATGMPSATPATRKVSTTRKQQPQQPQQPQQQPKPLQDDDSYELFNHFLQGDMDQSPQRRRHYSPHRPALLLSPPRQEHANESTHSPPPPRRPLVSFPTPPQEICFVPHTQPRLTTTTRTTTTTTTPPRTGPPRHIVAPREESLVSELSLSSQLRQEEEEQPQYTIARQDYTTARQERPQLTTGTARQERPLVQVRHTRQEEERPFQSLDSEQVHQILEIFPRASKERVQGLLKQQHSVRTIINLLAEESFSHEIPLAQHVEGRPFDGKKSTDDDPSTTSQLLA